jgi:hypothetical protein
LAGDAALTGKQLREPTLARQRPPSVASLRSPLVITRPEIDRVVAVLDKAIEEMGSQLGTS